MLFLWSLRTRELQLHATDAPNTLVFMFYSVQFRELYSSRKLGFSVFWVLRNSRLQRLAVMLHHLASWADESLLHRSANQDGRIRKEGHLQKRDRPQVRGQ